MPFYVIEQEGFITVKMKSITRPLDRNRLGSKPQQGDNPSAKLIMKNKNKSGFSLIEVMVAVLLLMVMAIGSAAVMYQTGGGVQRQQNKREAIVAANTVLESYWNTTYSDLKAAAVNSPISDSVLVNGLTMPSSVTISSGQDGGTGESYVEIKVSITYMAGETVDVISRRYEKGLSKARAN